MRPAACEQCLRRGALVGRLSPRIAGLHSRRPRPARLLGLGDEELLNALGGDATAELRGWLDDFDPDLARQELEALGIDCVCPHRPGYPGLLRDLVDPPAALYVAGGGDRLAALSENPTATVVGARDATPYGLEVARALGHGLAAAGLTVVSGLARGIDAAAHRGAAEAGDRLIAVLASGPDVPYPRENRALYSRIRAGGVVVSELPPGVGPMRWSFPARNRIMAALGRITVVVEAAEASGSLITAAFAGDIGRDIGAVPGRVTAAKAAGSNALLRDGARVIRGAGDVIEEILGVGAAEAAGDRGVLSDSAPGSQLGLAEVELDGPARDVLAAVEAGHGVGAIGRETRLGAGEVRAALGRLELAGLVRRDGLGLYERSASGGKPSRARPGSGPARA